MSSKVSKTQPKIVSKATQKPVPKQKTTKTKDTKSVFLVQDKSVKAQVNRAQKEIDDLKYIADILEETAKDLGISPYRDGEINKKNYKKMIQSHLFNTIRGFDGKPDLQYHLENRRKYEDMCNRLNKIRIDLISATNGKFDKLPNSIKEGLLDLAYNYETEHRNNGEYVKGAEIVKKNADLLEAIKNDDYSTIVANLTYIDKNNDKTICGLKRRSFNRAALACRDLQEKELKEALLETEKIYKDTKNSFENKINEYDKNNETNKKEVLQKILADFELEHDNFTNKHEKEFEAIRRENEAKEAARKDSIEKAELAKLENPKGVDAGDKKDNKSEVNDNKPGFWAKAAAVAATVTQMLPIAIAYAGKKLIDAFSNNESVDEKVENTNYYRKEHLQKTELKFWSDTEKEFESIEVDAPFDVNIQSILSTIAGADLDSFDLSDADIITVREALRANLGKGSMLLKDEMLTEQDLYIRNSLNNMGVKDLRYDSKNGKLTLVLLDNTEVKISLEEKEKKTNILTVKIPSKYSGIKQKYIPYIQKYAKSSGYTEELIMSLVSVEKYTDKATYKDENGGLWEVGFGHTTQASSNTNFGKGFKISLNGAFKWLVQDIRDKENLIKEFGNYYHYNELPQALKDAFIDVAFNRGEGRLDPNSEKFDKNYIKVHNYIESGEYGLAAACLKQTRFRKKYEAGLRKRNVIRFLNYMDTIPNGNEVVKAMTLFDSDKYYTKTLKMLKKSEAEMLKARWDYIYYKAASAS